MLGVGALPWQADRPDLADVFLAALARAQAMAAVVGLLPWQVWPGHRAAVGAQRVAAFDVRPG